MVVLPLILLGAAVVALLDGAIAQAIGIAALAIVVAVFFGGQDRPSWFVGFGWGRFRQH